MVEMLRSVGIMIKKVYLVRHLGLWQAVNALVLGLILDSDGPKCLNREFSLQL